MSSLPRIVAWAANTKTKNTNDSAHLVQYRFKIRESSPEKIRMTTGEKYKKVHKETKTKKPK